MSDKTYWRRRAKQYEEEWLNRCKEELETELRRYFEDSLEEIEKDIMALYASFKFIGQQPLPNFHYSEARRLIRGKEYRRWRMTLEEYVRLSHKDSKILRELEVLSRRSRISRLEKIYTDTLKSLQNLGEKYEKATKDFLTTAYKERYYNNIYDLAKVGKLEIPLAHVEPSKLEKVLAQKWQGGNYSSRIWKDTEKLSAELKKTITTSLHRGLSVQKLSKSLAKKMDVSYSNAERLVRTELNFVSNMSTLESLEAAGLKEYEFIATLDHRTTPRCQDLDGSVHLISEYEVGTNAPPMHPRCRSTISALVDGGTRTAKVNGKNVRIPADMKYKDYKAVYIDKSLTLEQWQKVLRSDRIKPNLKFNAQLFNDYEKQVKNHGGSGNIQPDLVHSSHSGNPRKAEPLQIIDHKNREGKIDKRAFYDSAGLIYLEIHTTNHNFPKTHPFGENGEHAHDVKWQDGKSGRPDAGREITDEERKDNADIL